MVNYQHRADRAVVQFSGELTHEAAVELGDTVDMLVRAYFHSVVELVIASLGGASSAREHYLDAQRRWRATGMRKPARKASALREPSPVLGTPRHKPETPRKPRPTRRPQTPSRVIHAYDEHPSRAKLLSDATRSKTKICPGMSSAGSKARASGCVVLRFCCRPTPTGRGGRTGQLRRRFRAV